MAKSFKDLIGGFQKPAEVPPVDVLEELKTALASKTVYRLEFAVVSTTSNDRATHSLRVSVANLGGYTAELLRVSHKVLQLYPCRISPSTPAQPELNSEEELRDAIGTIITGADFNATIGMLLAQA